MDGNVVLLERPGSYQKFRRWRADRGPEVGSSKDRDRNVLHQDLGKSQSLAHAAREGADPPLPDVAKAHAFKVLGDAVGRAAPTECRSEPRGVTQIVHRGHVVVEAHGSGR